MVDSGGLDAPRTVIKAQGIAIGESAGVEDEEADEGTAGEVDETQGVLEQNLGMNHAGDESI